ESVPKRDGTSRNPEGQCSCPLLEQTLERHGAYGTARRLMTRLRMAVIGVGRLGKEHARILAGLPEVDLVGVADVDEAQAKAVAARLHVQAYANYSPLLHKIDAACVVVPTSAHEEVARDLLRRGIPALVEKPLASSRAAAAALVDLSHKHRALLQVG